ncbi:MAG TPA: hypothetical protein VLZ31_04260 [Microbacteriaceae bacterium]|nr:hypothetical protein [Microbacteriaceae bacterium]
MSEVAASLSMQNEEQEVQIVRSVRFGRLMLVGAVAGAVIALLITLTMPVKEGALYTMNQIAGFMLVLGGVLGMALGAFLGLLLNLSARRKQGYGRAVHTGVTLSEAAPDDNTEEDKAEEVATKPGATDTDVQ